MEFMGTSGGSNRTPGANLLICCLRMSCLRLLKARTSQHSLYILVSTLIELGYYQLNNLTISPFYLICLIKPIIRQYLFIWRLFQLLFLLTAIDLFTKFVEKLKKSARSKSRIFMKFGSKFETSALLHFYFYFGSNLEKYTRNKTSFV